MEPQNFRKHVKNRYPAQAPASQQGVDQGLIVRGHFADRARDEFFNEAFGEILADIFVAWCQTEAHCTKEREYLYSTAVALGSLKGKLIDFTNLGKNTQFMTEQAAIQKAASSQEGTDDAEQSAN
jgi:hypothetical protein